MTEAVLLELGAAATLFAHEPARPLRHVSLAGGRERAGGGERARWASRSSDDEIDYLLQAFGALGRDPTDVELMMFAQANSEHCRHKIFNADWIIDGEPQRASRCSR